MITIKEIARIAGVTPKTAERALSGVTMGVRRDARERAERVRAIAQKMGYAPSETARNLRSGSSHTIGFLVDHLTDPFLSAAVEVSMDEAELCGYRVVPKIGRFRSETTGDELRSLLSSGADGILCACRSCQLPENLMISLAERKFPWVSLQNENPWGRPIARMDYARAVRNAVAEMARRGHTQLLLGQFTGKPVSNAASASAFFAACRENHVAGAVQENSRLEEVAAMAESAPAGVLLYGKYSMRVFMDERIRLKKPVELIGFFSEWTWRPAPFLAGAVMEHAESLVRSAVRQLIAQIENAPLWQEYLQEARFVPASRFVEIKASDLSNQYLIFHD